MSNLKDKNNAKIFNFFCINLFNENVPQNLQLKLQS